MEACRLTESVCVCVRREDGTALSVSTAEQTGLQTAQDNATVSRIYRNVLLESNLII